MQTHVYLTAKAVAQWVEDTFEVGYTDSGMTALLHRLGYVYKKPKLIPGKADAETQKAFLAEYDNLKQTKGEEGACCSVGSRRRARHARAPWRGDDRRPVARR
nr:winged helix-turn-helix domain-containing protein [Thiococcus pfennigii]